MRMTRLVVTALVVTALAMCLVSSASGATLEIGSHAPKLAGLTWLKGKPVDVPDAKGPAAKGQQAVVVEFWATWCPPCIESIPHLTELQHEYADKGVHVVGVTEKDPDNSLANVRQFVNNWADKMDYAIAFDDSGETTRAYMEAAGEETIPTAFVVDGRGRVAWIGHPGARLEDVIKELLAGTYDLETAKQLHRIDQAIEQAQLLGDWETALAKLDAAIKLKPTAHRWLDKFMLYTHVFEDADQAKAALRKAFALAADRPEQTAMIALQVTDQHQDSGHVQIAVEALKKARAKHPTDADLGVAYFTVLQTVGKASEARQVAASTIELLKHDPPALDRFANLLSGERYGAHCDLALHAIDLALAGDDEPSHLATKFVILNDCKGDVAAATAAGQKLVEVAADDPEFLNGFAWTLLTEDGLKGRYNALALTAAERMVNADGGKGWSNLDTLALAKFEAGAIDEAIKTQQQAIAACDAPGPRAALQASLNRYKQARGQ